MYLDRLTAADIHSPHSGGQRSEVRVSAGLVPSLGSEDESISGLFPASGAASDTQWVLPCRRITPVSASVFTQTFLGVCSLSLYPKLSLFL